MSNLSVMGILVDKRKSIAPKVQEVLTKHGEIIIARFGIHDPGEEQHGLITLHVRSSKNQLEELSNELSALDGVTVKHITMK